MAAAALTACALAAVGPLADPAWACSCATRDLKEEAARGNAVVVATRTDPGGQGWAVLQVEEASDRTVPARLTARMDFGGGCETYLAPGEVGAFLYERRKGAVESGCGEVDLDRALLRAAGAPKAVPGGVPVAVVAGAFGGSRLAALDEEGRPVAWDGRAGFAERVAACPDGTTVAVAGRAGELAGEWGPLELSMHDSATLALRRSIALEPAPTDVFPNVRVFGLRCTGPDRAQLVLQRGDLPAEFVTVNGDRTRATPLGEVEAAVPLRDGFLLNVGEHAPTLVRVDGTGGRRTVVDLPDLDGLERMAVSPDGQSVAYVAYDEEPGQAVVVRDLRTGADLGRWSDNEFSVSGLAWTGSGELLVRRWKEDATRTSPVVLDHAARRIGSWAPVNGLGWFDTVGDHVVTYGSARLQAIPRTGPAQTASDPRLAGALDLTALRPAETFLGATTPATEALDARSTDRTARGVLAALAGALVLAAGGALRARATAG